MKQSEIINIIAMTIIFMLIGMLSMIIEDNYNIEMGLFGGILIGMTIMEILKK